MRVVNDDDLVLVVRPDDLDAWRDLAAEQGWTRLVASPIVVRPGAACAMREADLVTLSTVIAG